MDRLIRAQAEIFHEGARLDHYGVVMRAALEELPLYTRDDIVAVAETLEWQPRLDGRLLAADMELRRR